MCIVAGKIIVGCESLSQRHSCLERSQSSLGFLTEALVRVHDSLNPLRRASPQADHALFERPRHGHRLSRAGMGGPRASSPASGELHPRELMDDVCSLREQEVDKCNSQQEEKTNSARDEDGAHHT